MINQVNDSIVINQVENFTSTRYNPFLRATTTTTTTLHLHLHLHLHPQNERFCFKKPFQQPIKITYSIWTPMKRRIGISRSCNSPSMYE